MWYDKRDNVTYYGKLYFSIQSTQFFLDTTKNSLLFEDVECYLQHNDDPFIELYYPIYYISKPINVGDVFRLKVSHPDYPTVTTEIVVPDLDDIVIEIDTKSFKFVPHGIFNQPSYQFDVVVDSKTKCASNNVILLYAYTKMKMDTLDKPKEAQKINLDFSVQGKAGNDIIKFKGLTVGFADKIILNDLDFNYEKIELIIHNSEFNSGVPFVLGL